MTEISASGGYTSAINLSPSISGFLLFQSVQTLALDSSGNVWTANNHGTTEILGMAKPVLRPVQACLKKEQTVCLP